MATVRITNIKHTTSLAALKVEGAVASESVRVVEEECLRWLDQKKAVQLDFSGVTYIDPAGVAMLKRMTQANLQIVQCPDFIHQLLNLTSRE